MKNGFYSLLILLCGLLWTGCSKKEFRFQVRENVPLDSIRLSDPCILADSATQMYYMTGTGGLMWKSKDLKRWSGPYKVTQTDPESWMGPNPMIWAAELHPYKGKYYYFATFTNRAVKIDTVRGNVIERRASHVLVSDKPDGPYVPMADPMYLPADRPTLDGTFWVDTDGKPYMVYCGEWLQNWNGTMEKIELKPDLSGSIGEGKVLFRSSDSPWSREGGRDAMMRPNKVTDGPYLFRTGTGRLGMIWTSWIVNDYTQGVAYSESGTLDGPWVQEENPITPPNHGHGMLFKTLEGKWLMSVHSHKNVNGHYIRIPKLFEIDLTGDKLVVGDEYQPEPKPKKELNAYVFSFFTDPTHSLFLATSRDGYDFKVVNEGKPIIAGDTIAAQFGIRDPHIYRGPDNAFYIAMTDLHVFGKHAGVRTTDWERPVEEYDWGNNRGIVLMKSYDLIHWTHHEVFVDQSFPATFGNVGCVWAPETIYDPVAKQMMVYFTMRVGHGLTKLYYAYTDCSFTRFVTEPKLLFEYPKKDVQVLDADITPLPDGRYVMMYVAQEGKSGIRMAVSDNINSGYQFQDGFVDFEPKACEAPNVWKRIGEDKWVLMYDVFSIRPHNFGFAETSDFKTFENLGHFNEGKMKLDFKASPKHGAVIQVTTEEAERLENYWKEH